MLEQYVNHVFEEEISRTSFVLNHKLYNFEIVCTIKFIDIICDCIEHVEVKIDLK